MFAPELPKPILFHPLKHHLQYIKAFIRESRLAEIADLKAALQTIGSSQLDFYTGLLTPLQISEEVLLYLQEQRVLPPEVYFQHLRAGGKDYRTITLSDGSDWVLRWGVVAERHVHLHPARYARHTIRVKANVLKTAVAALLAAALFHSLAIDLPLINQVRTQWLGLPPVKPESTAGGLAKLLELLR